MFIYILNAAEWLERTMRTHRVLPWSMSALGTLAGGAALWLLVMGVAPQAGTQNDRELSLAVAALSETAPSAPITPATAPTQANDATTARIPEPASELTPPTIEPIGETLITLSVGDSYTDDGARAFDKNGGELPLETYVNGAPTELVIIDTSTPGTHVIEYRAVDGEGATGFATRTVRVQ
jgi:hypothetical protein